MLAWTIENWGLKNLTLVERPSPIPGPGEVKVSFSAVSLNYRDLLVVKGHYNPKFPRPLVPCSDGFGIVVETGPGVNPSLKGRSVLSLFCPDWLSGAPSVELLRQTLGGPLEGVLQQERCFLPSQLVFLQEPSALTAVEWATLPCAGVTAWNCLVERGRLTAGQSVLLIGTGGVALFGLQIAKMMGARVLLLSSSQEKRERAKELGADSVHCYRGDPKWSRWVLDQTSGKGVDIVLETGGAGTLGESLKSVAVGGHISLVGVLSGSSHELDILPLVMKAVTVQGAVVGCRERSSVAGSIPCVCSRPTCRILSVRSSIKLTTGTTRSPLLKPWSRDDSLVRSWSKSRTGPQSNSEMAAFKRFCHRQHPALRKTAAEKPASVARYTSHGGLAKKAMGTSAPTAT